MSENNFRVARLDRTTWDDFVALFEQDRMTSQCWCLNHRVPVQEIEIEEAAKAEMQKRVCPRRALRAVTAQDMANAESGVHKNPALPSQVNGLLLYDGNEPVGWLGVEPLDALPGHDCNPQAKFGEWTIHCVYLLAGFRNKGATVPLIKGALELARERGAAFVSAFPSSREAEVELPHSMRFSGRIDTFLNLGFQLGEKVTDLYQRVEFHF